MKKKLYFSLFIIFAVIMVSCTGKDKKDMSIPAIIPFTFGVFGNSGLDTDNGISLDSLFRAAKNFKPEFMINLGNSIPLNAPSSGLSPLWDAADIIFEKAGVPIYPLAGINDVFDSLSFKEYTKRHGPLWYSFERNGVLFAAISGCDSAYNDGFGTNPRYSDEQIMSLSELFSSSRCKTRVVFTERPVWDESPKIWREKLLPVLKKGEVNFVIGCSPDGLRDYGIIDGIKTVTTGCTGIAENPGPGLYPHFLLIDIKTADDFSFRVLNPDGKIIEKIDIDDKFLENFTKICKSVEFKPIKLDEIKNPNETINFETQNNYNAEISGKITFTSFNSTRWKINPNEFDFLVPEGGKNIYKIRFNCVLPDLAPLPAYKTELKIGGRTVLDNENTVTIIPPAPRTGKVVPIMINTADQIPYSFNGKAVRIPVDIENTDTCGRLIVYREDEKGNAVCCYISPLVDFRVGIYNFNWNGRDLDGNPVVSGKVYYIVCAYNKKAPVTWVANGSWNPEGNFYVNRGIPGLVAETNSKNSLITYKLNAVSMPPSGSTFISPEDMLGTMPLISFAAGAGKTMYLLTDSGIASVTTGGNSFGMNTGFGDQGFFRFGKFRGRKPGSACFFNNLLYIAFGGGIGVPPGILVLDGSLGYEKTYIDLGDFLPEYTESPTITVNEFGIFCGHPKSDLVIKFDHYGNLQWVNEPGDQIGDLDSDGSSFIYGISVDKFGLAYIPSPGTSARCGIIGPDGNGLFRVILVQLPGLRVSSIFPMIEGKDTDGLYFVTRGGDVPYVFHVPYTVRTGRIGEL